MNRVSQVIDIALNNIQEHGWIQGSNVGLKGEMCMASALNRGVIEVTGTKNPIYNAPLKNETFQYMSTQLGSVIVIWNDATGRTQAEVEAALIKARDSA